MAHTPVVCSSSGEIADQIIEQVGNKIVVGLPLGVGKANHIVNALVDRAMDDPSIDLGIFTALTLESPQTKNTLQRRFLEPAQKRLFGDYPTLDYPELIRSGRLPQNIKVTEFFLLAGQWLGVAEVQQNFIPANYTHALDYLLERGMNVLAQIVSRDGDRFSLSCNSDISVDLLKLRARGDAEFVFAGQCNSELPFMYGDAQFDHSELDLLLDSPDTDFELYAAPKRPVSLADQAIGLHAASLIVDGGTLQIGIGAIGDAVANALIVRHRNNSEFRALLQGLQHAEHTGKNNDEVFQDGLYGVSEMLVDGFLYLAEHGILCREVDGAIMHAAFFVDCRDFYRRLRDMPKSRRKKFHMMAVSFTNELYGDEQAKKQARSHARFINSAMMATLNGAVISDSLEDGRVVSGVGGQFNFVAQAFALKNARSIITLNATRQSKGKTVSNILWAYPHQTIPWHLRDIIITEYGVADLRGTSESQAYKAMLCVTDSRFQESLLDKAHQAGKIERSWQIPEAYRRNTPGAINEALGQARREGLLPKYPFGTDFTDAEQRLMPALELLKNSAHSRSALARLFVLGLNSRQLDQSERDCLERLNLKSPASLKDFAYRCVLSAALMKTRFAL